MLQLFLRLDLSETFLLFSLLHRPAQQCLKPQPTITAWTPARFFYFPTTSAASIELHSPTSTPTMATSIETVFQRARQRKSKRFFNVQPHARLGKVRSTLQSMTLRSCERSLQVERTSRCTVRRKRPSKSLPKKCFSVPPHTSQRTVRRERASKSPPK